MIMRATRWSRTSSSTCSPTGGSSSATISLPKPRSGSSAPSGAAPSTSSLPRPRPSGRRGSPSRRRGPARRGRRGRVGSGRGGGDRVVPCAVPPPRGPTRPRRRASRVAGRCRRGAQPRRAVPRCRHCLGGRRSQRAMPTLRSAAALRSRARIGPKVSWTKRVRSSRRHCDWSPAAVVLPRANSSSIQSRIVARVDWDLRGAIALGRQSLAIAQSCGGGFVAAHSALGLALLMVNDPEWSRHLEAAGVYTRDEHDFHGTVVTFDTLLFAHFLAGAPSRCSAIADEMVRATEVASPAWNGYFRLRAHGRATCRWSLPRGPGAGRAPARTTALDPLAK